MPALESPLPILNMTLQGSFALFIYHPTYNTALQLMYYIVHMIISPLFLWFISIKPFEANSVYSYSPLIATGIMPDRYSCSIKNNITCFLMHPVLFTQSKSS